MHQTTQTNEQLLVSAENIQSPSASILLEKRIQKNRSAGKAGLGYWSFTSSRLRKDLPLFIAVHGIGRRAKDQARFFAPMVEALGATLIAPVFGRKRFAGYQRLGFSGKGYRPDLALQHLVQQVNDSMHKPSQPVVMFGYSGGGQFVHRYAMAYPRSVKRIAVAAPGWFTYPDIGIKFPHGLMRSSTLPDLTFDASRFLRIPSMVLVGEHDIDRDRAVNQEKGIDERQGRHRLERAVRWHRAMNAAARRYHYDTPYPFIIVPGCGHSFRDCMNIGQMGWRIMRFLFDQETVQPFATNDDRSFRLSSVHAQT